MSYTIIDCYWSKEILRDKDITKGQLDYFKLNGDYYAYNTEIREVYKFCPNFRLFNTEGQSMFTFLREHEDEMDYISENVFDDMVLGCQMPKAFNDNEELYIVGLNGEEIHFNREGIAWCNDGEKHSPNATECAFGSVISLTDNIQREYLESVGNSENPNKK